MSFFISWDSAGSCSGKRSHPTNSSVEKIKSDNIAANWDICDILVDKIGNNRDVLNSDSSPGLVQQVVMLQDRIQLAQHIISELRADLKQEKSVKYSHVGHFLILNLKAQEKQQLKTMLSEIKAKYLDI